jgi:imidazolonepropionase-like amidohydrolase
MQAVVLPRERVAAMEAGMTPLQALQSATLVAARLLRREKTLGKLEKGFVGDVVAVPGNPLENIRVAETPLFVMKDGKAVFSRPR